MPLPLSVGLVVLAAIVLIGLLGYWIDEAVEPNSQTKQAPRQHSATHVEEPTVTPLTAPAAPPAASASRGSSL